MHSSLKTIILIVEASNSTPTFCGPQLQVMFAKDLNEMSYIFSIIDLLLFLL